MLIEQTGNTPNLYLYAREQFDADLGLYYNRARYLEVGRGRFWSQDNFEGVNAEPISLHKYLYADNDPINKLDPSGNSVILAAIDNAIREILATATARLFIFAARYRIAGYLLRVALAASAAEVGLTAGGRGQLPRSCGGACVKESLEYALEKGYVPAGTTINDLGTTKAPYLKVTFDELLNYSEAITENIARRNNGRINGIVNIVEGEGVTAHALVLENGKLLDKTILGNIETLVNRPLGRNLEAYRPYDIFSPRYYQPLRQSYLEAARGVKRLTEEGPDPFNP